jgi:hypothetical protein
MEQQPTRERPVHVTVAAGILITLGGLVLAIGLAFIVLAALAVDSASLPDWVDRPPDSFYPVAAALGAGFSIDGLAQVVVGIGVLRGRRWAAVAGVILAMIGALLATLGLLRGFGDSAVGVTTVFLPVAAAYVYAAWAIAAHPGWFSPD